MNWQEVVYAATSCWAFSLETWDATVAIQSFGRCIAVAASYAELERRAWRAARLVQQGRRP